MANLRILMTPKFKNYSCHICGHKLNFKQFPANHIASAHLSCSADYLRGWLLDPSDETFTLPASLTTSLHYILINIIQINAPHSWSILFLSYTTFLFVLYRADHADMNFSTFVPGCLPSPGKSLRTKLSMLRGANVYYVVCKELWQGDMALDSTQGCGDKAKLKWLYKLACMP